MTRACLIGCPVKHSLSPRLHSYWLRQYKLKGEYLLREVQSDDLEAILKSLSQDGFAGCNLTIPHKQKALEFMDDLSPRASAISAINTVVVMKSGGLLGDNTDAFGYIKGLEHQIADYQNSVKSAAVLGAGGAAKAVIYALLEDNIPEITIFNRTPENGRAIVDNFEKIKTDSHLTSANWNDLGARTAEFDLIVNTTPLGMTGQADLDIDLSACSKNTIISDIVYNPRKTALLKQAEKLGLHTAEGIHMLAYQGAAGFEYWFDQHPHVDDALINHMYAGLS